jgi:transposase
MPKPKPPYPTQYCQHIIELARTGRTLAELAREFGPTAPSISNGIAYDARDCGKPFPGNEGQSTAEREELVHLRRRLRQVEQEVSMLAKSCVHGLPAKATRCPRRLPACKRELSRCQQLLERSRDVQST